MKFFYSTLVILTILLLTSCGTINNLGEGAHLASYKADKRGSLIVVKDGQATMLSEVQPDAIISSVMDFTTKLKVKDDIDAESLVKITQAVTSLGERTEAVNILRDALYRLAELKDAHNTIDDTTAAIFSKIIATAEKIAIADQTKENIKLQSAIAETAAQENISKGVLSEDTYLKIKKLGN